MLLAIYLAKEVAAILREILTHPTKKLYEDRTAHLLCSNYWVQPIYQELLHSSSRYGDYKDSNIRMLTGTIKADWIQLPVERYLAALPTLKQGVITGVFKIKGASPWAFFSCIAERARDMVGQLLGIRKRR